MLCLPILPPIALLCVTALTTLSTAEPTREESGYRSIWYSIGQDGGHGPKYSGGLGTYPANMVPMAVYAPGVKRTFFVWGGTTASSRKDLQIMISSYDHESGLVPRPRVVRDSDGFSDAHANPALAIDSDGHLWVFSATRHNFEGRKYRSVAPYDISAFELVESRYMAYPQPWYIPGEGFLFLFTQYTGGRELYFQRSRDGRIWSEPRKFVGFKGHYQNSACFGKRVGTCFNYHPGGVDKRTNLYYLQTDDLGDTWTTVAGAAVQIPLKGPDNPTLVHDYQAEKRLVYIHDLAFDADGRPVILYLTSANAKAGPQGDPRTWHTAHWNGARWNIGTITDSSSNYDVGCLHIERDGWRVIGPSGIGPQRWGTGGEMAMWESADGGARWRKLGDLTASSPRNHTYARRPVPAHPDFYAFWADGDTDKDSDAHLYFCNRDGQVFLLPPTMDGATAKPRRVR